MATKITLNGIECKLTKKCVSVKSSRDIEYSKVFDFCRTLHRVSPIDYTRSAQSWAKEIIAHNMLFDLNMFTDHTQDTELEEEESLIRILGYEIIYFMYVVVHGISSILKGFNKWQI